MPLLNSHRMENSGVIDGVKYDRVLLEKAEGAAARNSGLMNLGDVAALWDDASSDGTSTDSLGDAGGVSVEAQISAGKYWPQCAQCKPRPPIVSNLLRGFDGNLQ